MPDCFPYRGSFSGSAICTFIQPGRYIIGLAGVPDGPEDFGQTSAALLVYPYGSFIQQTLSHLSDPSMSWVRTVRTSGTVGPWVKVKRTNATAPSYTGKVLAGFGDSVMANNWYLDRVGEMLGLGRVINGAFGGSRMSATGGAMGAFCFVAICNAIASGDWSDIQADAEVKFLAGGVDLRAKVSTLAAVDWADVDYVLFGFGANDWANGVPVSDICAAADEAIETLLTAYPHLRLMLITPSWRARQTVGDAKDSDTFPNPTSGQYLVSVVDGLKGVAEKWHIPACDLYRTQGLNRLTYERYLRNQNIDGLHPYGETGVMIFADPVASCFGRYF